MNSPCFCLPEKSFISSSLSKWRIVISNRQEPNQVKLTIALVYCLEFSGHSMGKVTQVEPRGIQNWSPGRSPWLECIGLGQSLGGRSCTERASEMCRGASRIFNRTLISTCIWENNPRPERKHPKGFLRIMAIAHCCCKSDRKTSYFMGIGQSTQRGLALAVEIY